MKNVLVYGDIRSVAWVEKALERELPVKVRSIVATENFMKLSPVEMVQGVEEELKGELGGDEIVVLADPLVATITKAELERRYPKQKIIGYGQGIAGLVQGLEKVHVLVERRIKSSEVYQEMKAKCQQTEIVELDTVGWVELLRERWVTKEEITEQVRSTRGAPIIVFHPELPFRKMQELIDWRNELVDIERLLLDIIRRDLKLRRRMEGYNRDGGSR